MRWCWPGLWTLAACSYPALEPAQLCDEVTHAVAARTLACTDDEDLATERAAAFEPWTCSFEAGSAFTVERALELYQCPADLMTVPCEAVEAQGDVPAWWLDQSPLCPQVWFPPSEPQPLDTGTPGPAGPDLCPFTEDDASAPRGSCGNPVVVDFTLEEGEARWTERLTAPDAGCLAHCDLSATGTDVVLWVYTGFVSRIEVTAPEATSILQYDPGTRCGADPICVSGGSHGFSHQGTGPIQVVVQAPVADMALSVTVTRTPF